MEDDKLPSLDLDEGQDDKGSNNGSGSHSSEEFVKVNNDDASLDAAGDIPREDVEDIHPVRSDSPAGLGGNLMDKLDPRTIPTEAMSSDNYLKDYYDQLPSETAEFTSGQARDLVDSPQPEVGDGASVLQPEVLPGPEPFEPFLSKGLEGNLAAELSQGGHSSFEPAPAASFEPDSPHAVLPPEITSQPGITESELLLEEEVEFLPKNKDIEDSPQGNPSENAAMSTEQERLEDQATPEGGIQVFDAEPEFEPEVKYEPEEEVAAPEEEAPPFEPKMEVQDAPAPPVVEDIETKIEPTPVSSHVPAAVIDLIYWRDVKKTACVFSFLLLMLGSLVCFSVISVIAFGGLAVLMVTLAFRLYKLVLQTLNGTQQPHPFQPILDLDISISEERVQKYANAILGHVNCCLTCARDLFLVKNTISSLKFGVFLWLLTYVGCLFNGLTLIIIDVILAFTVPPIYEKYQTPIDAYYGMAREKALGLITAAKAKFPAAKQVKEKAQ